MWRSAGKGVAIDLLFSEKYGILSAKMYSESFFMQNCISITEDLVYLGGNDRRIALFESAFPVPRGV